MKRMELITSLMNLERQGVFGLTKKDIGKLFPLENDKSMEKSLQRMVKDGLLIKAARGIYINALVASHHKSWTLQNIANALRPDKLSYVSFESMLSEHGVISQIPLSRLTVMNTGASGIHDTPCESIEFTHTKHSIPEILDRTIFVKDCPLRIAKKQAAVTDLLQEGRNTE